MTSPERVAALAQFLLTSAATALGVTAPARQYLSAGTAAADFVAEDGCDSQLTIWVASSTPGLVGAPQAGRPSRSPNSQVRSYGFVLELVRSSSVPGPNGEAPLAAHLSNVGRRHMLDYAVLHDWFDSLGFDSKLQADLDALGALQIAPGTYTTAGPNGGVVAIRAAFSVAI